MNQIDIDTRLRAIDPAADLDRDSSGPAADRMLTRIRSSIDAPTPTSRSRPTRTVALVAAVLTVTSTAAVASGVFRPDPADVGTILDDAADAAEVHLPGWRPSLRSETVICHYGPDASNETVASEFPLDEPLTRQRIEAECMTGNDMVRTMDDAPAGIQLCAATIASEAYEQRLAERDTPLLNGDLDGAEPVLTVGLASSTTCDGTQLTHEGSTPMALRPLTDDDLARINRTREVEVSLRAVALEHCLSRDEAIALADQARQHLDGQWPLLSLPDRPIGQPECNEIWIDAWGLLILQGR